MGANVSFRTLYDFPRRDANLEVFCRCGHKGVLDAKKVGHWFSLHGWNVSLEMVPAHLRCRKCKQRPVKIRPTPSAPDRPDWMNEDRKWKELARRLRG